MNMTDKATTQKQLKAEQGLFRYYLGSAVWWLLGPYGKLMAKAAQETDSRLQELESNL